jgi:hypothetical protein
MNIVCMYIYLYYNLFECGQEKEGYKELYIRTK